MHSTELTILALWLIILAPAVIAPLIWAAILDGRYDSIRRHRDPRRTQPRAHTPRSSVRADADIQVIRSTI